MTRIPLGVLVVAVAFVAACKQRPASPPKAKSERPPSFDSVMADIDKRILADTNSDASRQLNLMSAPIDTLQLAETRSDTIRWTTPSDSCALLIRTRHSASQPVVGDDAYFGGEAVGSTGFTNFPDIAPSPDWTWIAYGYVAHMRNSAEIDSAAATSHASRADVLAHAVLQRDGTRIVVIPVIQQMVGGCAGDACDLEAASPAFGGWRVGWTPNGKALVAGRETPPRWVALDPETRKPIKGNSSEPVTIRWISRSMTDLFRAHSSVHSPSGEYTFTSRNDSLVVRGPDRHGRIVERFVGDGVPVTSTRNGEYLLALRRHDGRVRPVIYYFRLFHGMMHSSCDR